MAIPTALNGQITDSVTQAGLSVLASAPAVAMGTLYQSMAHSMGILYQNSAMAQQQAAISSQAAANLGVIQMYSVNTMAGATAAARLGRNDNTDLLLALLVVLAVAKKK
ncbi:RebB family R body protein [Methylomagnum ishizawai]|uniref:RebB family R body protein n=1 Tax=Methylomagnum ishizawai TaxID=1760988 RepID=UPI001C33729D|nr:RebB family R body protein [Methylomagnum ishizawai]BBL74896.1 RebB protein [Methylomagnum ishizawai]